ncbi:choloylglycine hydrolase family protein [Lactococcus nasutitermitis]|uniref:Choloylglycine hydrolase family protein n=1 Tax=Lactococcus nasutitermitis TaxID=1652957 RepID=A0ABV9JF56_9LACT|nr:choloylglycine hydrolase family protein [Lactococcus nasutitermitis]
MCTSIQMKAKDGSLLLARTMDWHYFDASVLELKAGHFWHSFYDGKRLINPYAVLGVGHISADNHLDISDGINEYGLAAQKLTFSRQAEYTKKASVEKLSLAPFEFVAWLLGNCRSVTDAISRLNQVELMTDTFAQIKYGQADLHFVLTDRTGRLISIEPLGGRLIVKENPVGVVTNAPIFEREVEKLADYMDVSSARKELNKISSGNFSGKLVFPGGFTPTSRFIRAAVLKERAVIPENEQENLIETWHILNAVTVPKSDGRSGTYTIYRSAVDVQSRTLYFEAYDDLQVSSYHFFQS